MLAEKCFGCHGPDVADAKGGLRLDDRLTGVEHTRVVAELLA